MSQGCVLEVRMVRRKRFLEIKILTRLRLVAAECTSKTCFSGTDLTYLRVIVALW